MPPRLRDLHSPTHCRLRSTDCEAAHAYLARSAHCGPREPRAHPADSAPLRAGDASASPHAPHPPAARCGRVEWFPGQDSNLESQDQNLTCCQLHHRGSVRPSRRAAHCRSRRSPREGLFQPPRAQSEAALSPLTARRSAAAAVPAPGSPPARGPRRAPPSSAGSAPARRRGPPRRSTPCPPTCRACRRPAPRCR